MKQMMILVLLSGCLVSCASETDADTCLNSLDCEDGYVCEDGVCTARDAADEDVNAVQDISARDETDSLHDVDMAVSDEQYDNDETEHDLDTDVSDEQGDIDDMHDADTEFPDEQHDEQSDEDVQMPLPYPKKSPYYIKGIQPDYRDIDDIAGNLAGRVSMNIVWTNWEPVQKAPPCDSSTEYEFNGSCYVIDTLVDSTIKAYSERDINVIGILYGVPAWARTGNTDCSPNDTGFEIFCSPDNPSLYGKFTAMIARRYNGLNGNGRVTDFVIHNEVNSNVWFDIGCGSGISCDQEEWIQEYADNYNAAYDGIIAQQPHAKVLASFEHHFGSEFDNMTSEYPTIGVQTFLTSFAPKVAPRNWRIAYHAYPPDLTTPSFSIFDWPKVTFGNIGVIVGWLIQTFPAIPSAHEIQLTENGISSHPGDSDALQAQADWLCKSFQTVLGTPGISSYIYHRMQDHSYEVASGAALGLADENGDYKPAWSVWALANRYDLDPQQLSCGFENLPYVKLTRYNNGAKHWATTRIPPDGYTAETSWSILREPETGTEMIFECLAGTDDNFISAAADCDGQMNYGPLGYVHKTQVTGSVALYRCSIPGSHHFISPDPSCEGQTMEHLIGYVFPGK